MYAICNLCSLKNMRHWEHPQCFLTNETALKKERRLLHLPFFGATSLALGTDRVALLGSRLDSWRSAHNHWSCQNLVKIDERTTKLVGGFNPLENISQIGNLPQIGVKIQNIWNHHQENLINHLLCFTTYFLKKKWCKTAGEWSSSGNRSLFHKIMKL